MLNRMIPEARIGLVLGGVLLALSLCFAWLYQRLWLGSIVPYVLFFIVFVGFALGRALDAMREGEGLPAVRWRRIVVIPLIVIGVWLFDGATGLTSRASALGYLATHQEEMRAAEAARPGQPVALRYIDGIPDGGWAIVRAEGDPRRLPVAKQLELVNENIHRCNRIGGRDWVCSFD